MASLRLALVSIVAALALVAAPAASAIVDGEPDRTHEYTVFVGGLVSGWACSGTLVSPTVVVTAAHCGLLRGTTSAPNGQPFLVRQGRSFADLDAEVVGTYFRHPQFCIGCPGGPQGFGNNDLAVIVLSQPLEGPYANLPKEGWVGKHFEREKQLVVVGWGVTQVAPPLGLGTRRSVQARAVLLSEAPNFLELPPPSKDKYGVACAGDSGGSNLVGNTLVAVTSIGTSGCGGPNYAYRVDTAAARSFLSQYVDLR